MFNNFNTGFSLIFIQKLNNRKVMSGSQVPDNNMSTFLHVFTSFYSIGQFSIHKNKNVRLKSRAFLILMLLNLFYKITDMSIDFCLDLEQNCGALHLCRTGVKLFYLSNNITDPAYSSIISFHLETNSCSS